MDITRKNVENIVNAHNGFVRLDTLCRDLGLTPNAENLWTVHDKLVQSVLPAFRQDALEGERDYAIVLVSHRRRGQHDLSDSAFPEAPMPDKPAHMVKKKRNEETKAKRDAVLIAAGLKDEDQKDVEKYLPGFVKVDVSWFTRDDAAESFRRYLVEYIGEQDEESPFYMAEIAFCKPGTGDTFAVTLRCKSREE